jgi:phosphoribosyl 1,2-cyclic phosphate phosphodiesterase
MEIRLLGTGAAEGIPAFYSASRVSMYAREHGGKDVRTRCSALVDGGLKIDLPPDTVCQLQREKLDARDWSGLLFTHGDDDHFAPRELQYGLYPFNEMDHLGFVIYGNDKIVDRVEKLYPDWPIEIYQIAAFQPFQHCEFTITPIQAHHNEKEQCLNHIIQRGGKTLLYATDTGVWREPTWEFLGDFRLDCLVIECTEGLANTGYEGHLDLPECLEVIDRLRTMGVLGAGSRVVTTHHSHLGEATFEELQKVLCPHAIEAGFDGMTVTF